MLSGDNAKTPQGCVQAKTGMIVKDTAARCKPAVAAIDCVSRSGRIAVMPSQRSSVPAPVSLRQLLPWRTFAPLSSEERAPAIAFQRAVTT